MMSPPDPPAPPAGHEPMVFVVDDDPAMRQALRYLLTARGYVVVTCRDGAEFLDGYRPGVDDCLLVNVHMPRIGGFALLEALQQRGVRIPALMMTGAVRDGDVERALALGALAILAKPFDENVLLEQIDSARRLGRRAGP